MKGITMVTAIFLLILISLCYADLQDYSLINATSIKDAMKRCRITRNGTLRTFPIDGIHVEEVFHNMPIVNNIWNGYYVETDFLENTGCFLRKSPISSYSIRNCDMSVAQCWRFCKLIHHSYQYALRSDECHCIEANRITDPFFDKVNASLCPHLCESKGAEYCGTSDDQELFNIYKIGRKVTHGGSTGTVGQCKVYNNTSQRTANALCSDPYKRLCRGNIAISSDLKSWRVSTESCVAPGTSSYMVSYADTLKLNLTENDEIWLNEKIYTTTLDNVEIGTTPPVLFKKCEILTRGRQREIKDCTGLGETYFLCLSENEISDKCLYHNHTTTRSSQTSTSSLPSFSSSTQSLDENASSTMDKVLSTSPTSSRSISELSTSAGTNMTIPTKHSDIKAQSNKDDNDGAIIGSVLAVCVFLTGVVIIVILMRRKRAHEKDKHREDDTYQRSHTVKVKFAKAKGFTNSAYCAEATLDIIHGNPDRNSQDAYMTIADEDLNRNVNGNFHNLQGIDETPPEGMAHTYFTLSPDAAKGSTPVVKNAPSPYDLAKPITLNGHTPTDEPVNRVDGVNTTGPKDVDYDHLSHEAYKGKTPETGREEENEYSHADIAESNGYSSTNGKKDDDTNPYSHTNRGQTDDLNTQDDNEDYSHVQGGVHSPGGNNEDDLDAYSHAT